MTFKPGDKLQVQQRFDQKSWNKLLKQPQSSKGVCWRDCEFVKQDHGLAIVLIRTPIGLEERKVPMNALRRKTNE